MAIKVISFFEFSISAASPITEKAGVSQIHYLQRVIAVKTLEILASSSRARLPSGWFDSPQTGRSGTKPFVTSAGIGNHHRRRANRLAARRARVQLKS